MLEEAREASKHARKLGRVMGIVAAHRLKHMREFLAYEELAIWRRMNGFDRVAEGEQSCFHGHRSLPPTPEQYGASLWCEVNALKTAISILVKDIMPRLWQKTIDFVNGLKGKLPDDELAVITECVEKRSRDEAAKVYVPVKPVGTVQHCSPCSPNPDRPSGVYFNLENEERMELDELKPTSAGTGLKTPGRQCPPIEGIWETGKTTASGILTAGAGPSRRENISSPAEREKSTTTIADISSKAATPSNRRHKTSSEENKQFDPRWERREGPALERGCTLLPFSGEIGEAFCLCFVFCLCSVCACFPKLLIYPGETYQQAERHWGRYGSSR